MNIFVLSYDPEQAAVDQCNKHVVKMILETAQLLCTAHDPSLAPYKHTHYNHPCAKWTRASSENYDWLLQHGMALCREYTKRYGKVHKTESVMGWLASHDAAFDRKNMTPFAIAIKDERYHLPDVVESYRAYYIGEKKTFARWSPVATPPKWWPHEEITAS